MFKSIHVQLMKKKEKLLTWSVLGAISAAVCIPVAVITLIKLKKK